MNDPGSPGMLTRMRAAAHGEVSADTLEAYRRAGLGVYDALSDAEELRAELVAEGTSLWDAPQATQAVLLCSWSAFALQTLGDHFLDADYKADPKTVGFVPPVTRGQVLALYEPVEMWLGRVSQAQSNPGYELDFHAPAELPRWVEVEPCPREHLQGMLASCRHLTEHAEIAVADAERSAGDHAGDVAKLREALAQARSSAEYGERLNQDQPDRALHERIERSAKAAVEGAYLTGQLAAMPTLIGRPEAEGPVDLAALAPRLAGPGEPGFDPWCLTAPSSRESWQRDPSARSAIETLWRLDPDARATLEIQSQLDEGLRRGHLDYATERSGRRLGYYFCCPWSAIYVAKRPVTVGGRRMRAGEQFTFDVSAEEMAEGGAFKRGLLLADFSATREIDYCDPTAGGHY